MRSSLWLVLALSACAYVTRGEYDGYWDADGDGWPLDQDCAPDDPDIYPYAPDPRGDGCDSDCGMEPDADGDDWPDAADCAPDDPEIFPCSPFEVSGDGVDSDCDARDEVRVDVCAGTDPDFPDAEPLSCGEEAA